MRTVQDIVFGVSGQQIVFDCPEGRPSEVTSVEVFWWDSSDLNATLDGVGSVETGPNTTFDAASGYGQANPLLMNLTATTNVTVGRTYLATTADGAREWVEIAEVDSGVSATAKHPLHNSFIAADTFQSTRITATLDSNWLSDETNLDETCGPNPSHRVRWVYVVGGVTYVADSYFTFVRYKGAHGIRPQDVEALMPGWLDRLPTDHYRDQGQRLIDDAYRGVKFDLHQVWTDDAMVANSELVDELTRYKTLELTEMQRAITSPGTSDSYTIAKAAYQSRLDQLQRITNKAPIRDYTGAATNRVSIGLTRR